MDLSNCDGDIVRFTLVRIVKTSLVSALGEGRVVALLVAEAEGLVGQAVGSWLGVKLRALHVLSDALSHVIVEKVVEHAVGAQHYDVLVLNLVFVVECDRRRIGSGSALIGEVEAVLLLLGPEQSLELSVGLGSEQHIA